MARSIKAALAQRPAPKDASPRALYLPYQRAWANDRARFKIGLWARQTGKDFSCAGEGVTDCCQAEQRGQTTTYLLAAPSERQSLESFEQWKLWAASYKLAIADYIEEHENLRNSESLIKSATITFPHGSRVIAVPGRPDTVRGFSANVVATEFAFFEDPDATWRALVPSITNPLRGGLKKVRLISTPNGLGNKFQDLWSHNYQTPGAQWSCHKITITDAVAQGLPVDLDELRAAFNDPDGWAQEYDPLEFLDLASVLLPYDLIATIENPNATAPAPVDFWAPRAPRPLYLGIDFGRSHDLTVCWTLEDLAGAFALTREVLELNKLPTPTQVELLRPRLAAARRACLDYTGPGVGLGDYLVREFGEYNADAHKFGKLELCTFTNQLKQDIFPKLRMAAEARKLGIPIARAIREDLHSMSRVTTPSGNITYKAPHTDDGHADRCTALALAWRAWQTRATGALTTTAGITIGHRPASSPHFTPATLSRSPWRSPSPFGPRIFSAR